MNTQNIPSLDLADFKSNDIKRKNNFVELLGKAYADIGFVAIKNHGIPENTINQLYEKIEFFFNLPTETKKKYEIENIGGQRGYTSFGKEHAKNSDEGDLKEFWHFGQELKNDALIEDGFLKNIFVNEIPDFLEIGNNAFNSFEDAGIEILKAIALYLGLNEQYFTNYVINGNSILRPIHYPPISDKNIYAVRAGEHEDINLITLLVGASAEWASGFE